MAFLAAILVLALSCGCRKASATATASRPQVVAAEKLSFNELIQPILSENCYSCHGTDSGARKAELRLDRPEDAFAPRKNGSAIVKGDPDHSLLIQRLLARDSDVIMPPPESHKTLKPDQIALLRQWIAEGAVYEPHWAFVAPRRSAMPEVKQALWTRNPVDRFILARLEKENLAPSPEADRTSLLRRVTYDLTGLPPTPAEIEAFLGDLAPEAYERVVDRLLASPRYGEHRARYWLDYARYGDTHGIHLDNFRSIWPYRDYVIHAFNANLPFDQFTREQIAGDLLPARNLDQQLASAFIRAGISSGEGGAIIEEMRVNNQRERVEAFGAVFLGLTTGCAACHDHKFDPLSQKDHYQLTAFFKNLEEKPSNDDLADWAPVIHLPKAADRVRYDALLTQRADLEAALAARRARAPELIRQWLATGPAPQPVDPTGLQVHLLCNEQTGATLANSAPHPAFASVTSSGGTPLWGEDSWFWPSFRMETSTRVELSGIGDIERSDAFTVAAWIMPRMETNASGSPNEGTILGRMDSADGMRGWNLLYDRGRLTLRLVHNHEGDFLAVTTEQMLMARGHWSHVLAVFDGSGRASGVRLYVDGEQQPTRVILDALDGSIRTNAPLLLGAVQPDATPLRQTRFQEVRYYARALDDHEARRVAREDYVASLVTRAPEKWNEDEARAVADLYFAQYDPESKKLVAQIGPLQKQLEELTHDGAAALVASESPRLAYADVLRRGDYRARQERVRPGPPHFLPPLPAGAPRNRAGLAEWTVAAANPLTARVTVNRMWAEIFGTGIVETTEDFGIVGARPSHPQLLDWLAVEFRESSWDMKKLYRLLVTSATYRQSAKVTPALLEADPRNRLLARGPRYRLDAEELRDTALAASGLLVEQLGGPSVKPYQPPGVWENGGYPTSNTTHYTQDTGDALHRRSLYTFWKRMAPMANMDIFDAATRDAACTRRQRTNTPIQALVTMNDVQWLEASRRLAENLVGDLPDDDTRLERLGLLLLTRPWQPAEKSILVRQLNRFRATYAADPAAAAKLIKSGEAPLRPALDAPEVAAWMLITSTAFNRDATLNK